MNTTTNSAKGRIVGHEDEAVEPGADADAGRDQGNVHGAEEEHPAPCHGPVRQEPEVDRAVERHQRDQQEHVPPVVGVPEARSVGYLDDGHQPDEPATPDRNPCRIRHDIGIGPYRRRKTASLWLLGQPWASRGSQSAVTGLDSLSPCRIEYIRL